MKWIVVVGAAALSGCSLMQIQQPPPPDVNGILNGAFRGGPATRVIEHFGAPLRQMPVGEDVVYSWEQDRTMYFQTQPPAYWHCQMDTHVDPQGMVRAIVVRGDMGACTSFLR